MFHHFGQSIGRKKLRNIFRVAITQNKQFIYNCTINLCMAINMIIQKEQEKNGFSIKISVLRVASLNTYFLTYILVSNPTYRLPFYTLPINRLPPLDCHQKNVSEFSKEKKITITHQFLFCITKISDLLNAPTLNRR